MCVAVASVPVVVIVCLWFVVFRVCVFVFGFAVWLPCLLCDCVSRFVCCVVIVLVLCVVVCCLVLACVFVV